MRPRPQLISSPRAFFRASLTMCAATSFLSGVLHRRAAFFLLLPLAAAVGAAEPEARLVVKPDAFKTLVNPNCSHCKDEANRRAGELRDDDRVLCWSAATRTAGPSPSASSSTRIASSAIPTASSYTTPTPASPAAPRPPWTSRSTAGERRHGHEHKDGTLYSCLTGLAFGGRARETARSRSRRWSATGARGRGSIPTMSPITCSTTTSPRICPRSRTRTP